MCVPAVRRSVQSEDPVPVLPSGCQGLSITEWWPFATSLELRALPGAVPCARLHARQVLWEWGLGDLSESAELLVSELVTNAVRAARAFSSTPIVRFWILSDNLHVLILVWDPNRHRPNRVHRNEREENGRGLLLVDAISDHWGSYAVPGRMGKVVWALVSAPAS